MFGIKNKLKNQKKKIKVLKRAIKRGTRLVRMCVCVKIYDIFFKEFRILKCVTCLCVCVSSLWYAYGGTKPSDRSRRRRRRTTRSPLLSSCFAYLSEYYENRTKTHDNYNIINISCRKSIRMHTHTRVYLTVPIS